MSDDIPTEWQQMDQSERMYSLYAELRLIREGLSDGPQEPQTRFVCNRCDWDGATKEAATNHALEAHKCPTDLVDDVISEVIE
jgi:hypothetical protein